VPSNIIGILLAAGAGRRYGKDKLTERLPDGESVAFRACRHLLAAVADVIVVTRPGSMLTTDLSRLGARVIEFDGADAGMGASLARGVTETVDADGWIVALADMPFIRPATIGRVAEELKQAGGIVAPCHLGKRGHPVGFARSFGAALRALEGDRGARAIVDAHRNRLRLLAVDDPGILRDIDTPADLR